MNDSQKCCFTGRRHMVQVLMQPQCTCPGDAYWRLHAHGFMHRMTGSCTWYRMKPTLIMFFMVSSLQTSRLSMWLANSELDWTFTSCIVGTVSAT